MTTDQPKPPYTCEDCGRDDLTALGLMLCCSPLNNQDELNN